jgi:hypothetical protein
MRMDHQVRRHTFDLSVLDRLKRSDFRDERTGQCSYDFNISRQFPPFDIVDVERYILDLWKI